MPVFFLPGRRCFAVASCLLALARLPGAEPVDPFKAQGNVAPKIVRLTPEQEAAILKDVKVPEGFDVTLFANSAAANYPVFVAAAPNGDLYVSSDGNGSLGRDPHRGRILRLRDKDGDGRADEVTEFVKDLDSPRGLVWDHDRLYVVHPPHVSVFIDRDGDGVADESKILIKDIAFGFADRPADHTTNGLSLGIDGWLYVAGGDFGYMKAVGTDGRTVQHRGGGVTRFRPDGTGLEIFSRGTRNIVEVAVGPLLNIFSRDNTNDGGGWDIRFEQFTGLEHHGYPYLYKNFGGEHVKALADYGGGSGCGALFLDEPGFGKWNGPLTADWGTGALWHHTVAPSGASYTETAAPEKFVAMTRPTDADADALSHVYQASWKGASFNWVGADVGYIVRVTPKDFKAPALPEFDRVTAAELVALLDSPSHRTRLEAQRALLRRELNAETRGQLLALAGDKARRLESRVAAVFALTQRAFGGNVDAALAGLATDTALQPYVVRALADGGKDAPIDAFAAGLASADAHVKLEAIVGAVRRELKALAPQVAALLGDADERVAHTAFRGLAVLGADEAAFAVLDSAGATAAQRQGAVRALQLMHTKAVVDGLLLRLGRETALPRRQNLISVLCRLHFTDGEWKGDSWGTRPDTRGPYYQPEAWSETPRIAAAIKDLLAKAVPAEAGFLVGEMNLNRIQSNEALERIIALAGQNPELAADAVMQMAALEEIPKVGWPMLIRTARDPAAKPGVLAQTVTALAKTDSADGARAMLAALVALDQTKGTGKEKDAARTAFINAPKLDVLHEIFEAEAANVGTPAAAWAEAALLKIAGRAGGSPEAREMVAKALATGWENPPRRVQIITAADKFKLHTLDDKILAAVDDPAPEVAKAAKSAVTSLRLGKRGAGAGPLVSSLKIEDVIAQVVKMKGDAGLGEQLFVRQTCVACHTVSQAEAQKGPYLGNIAQTYTRTELARNILEPGATIAQGFATELIKLKDGSQQVGFITLESADNVKMRNVAAQEFTFAVKDIAERIKLPISVMPPGLVDALTVREFASLLDYLEALAKK
jgi:putative heme-binding domain-containing protein